MARNSKIGAKRFTLIHAAGGDGGTFGRGGSGTAIDILITGVQAVGGLGLFLLGMLVMTDGLRGLAGDATRAALTRFTRSPATGAATGAVTTALLQSSSATTVAAVGFVSAGLLTFPQALGIVFGANIGTTITGWLVALLGFKLKLGTIALPLIFVGVVMRLFFKGKVAQAGYALAGFGTIFVGITAMQQAMEGLEGIVTPDTLPPDTLPGRLALVLIGIAITLVTQSSSAGVAAAITMIAAGAISFHQGAAMVIGMDVGTTVTAAMAAVGGTVGARRTGLSHVIYNLMTGLMALLLISPYVWVWDYLAAGQILANPEIALVAFHTTFNAIGVGLVLPFARPFARLIETIFPEEPRGGSEPFEPALLENPPLALDALQRSIESPFVGLIRHLNFLMDDPEDGHPADLDEIEKLLDESEAFADRIGLGTHSGGDWERFVALLHALDHLQRLHERCEEDSDRALVAREIPELHDECALLALTGRRIIIDLHAGRFREAVAAARAAQIRIHDSVPSFRGTTMAQAARDEISMQEATRRLEAIRWLRRVSKHLARITRHYHVAVNAAAKMEGE